MAKKRKGNILDASTDELKNIGKTIMKKVEVSKPLKSPKNENSEAKGRDKMLYVTANTHKIARIQAAQRDMKLKEYITFLILEDKENL